MQVPDFSDIVISCPFCRIHCKRLFKLDTCLNQFAHFFPSNRYQRKPGGLGLNCLCGIRDAGAIAWPNGKQTDQLQCSDCLTNGASPNTELFHELGFGGELVARLQRALGNHCNQTLQDLITEATAPNFGGVRLHDLG